MELLEVFALALGLTLDVFSVSIAVGLSLPNSTLRQRIRLTFHFALFHFFMPVLGWLAGLTIQRQIAGFDHWVAFGLLCFVGIKMIREARSRQECFTQDPTRGVTMVVLCIATSVDALALGISVALLSVDIWNVGILLGLFAALMSSIGLNAGAKAGRFCHAWSHWIGGLAIIAVGLKILIEHTLGA